MTSNQRTFQSETPRERKRRLNNERQAAHYRRRQRRQNNISIERHDLGRMDQICTYCGAKFWMNEKDKHSTQNSPSFAVCCAGGKVGLPPLLRPPPYLMNLYTSLEPEANAFRRNVRSYNSLLACTSFGADVNGEFQRSGLSNFTIHGQVYHFIGSLLPNEGEAPKFAQLYIYDTENEMNNRLNIMQNVDVTILQNLQNMLDVANPYIQVFRQARDIIQASETSDVSMVIHGDCTKNLHRYEAPTSSDVAVLMIGDGCDIEPSNRNILLRQREGGLQKISELHPSYDPLHYVLLFPRGDNGWHPDIPLLRSRKRNRVTQMQFYSYRLQIKNGDWIQNTGRLYQQYIVDQYAKIKQNRLNYLRENQSTLRIECYQGAVDAIHAGDSANNIGQHIILPSTFSGGPQQMYQLYQDAIAIVHHFGKPDLFITFTCNPKWPEITRELLPNQTAADRPDLTARVFNMKLREMMKDLCERHWLGEVAAYIYVIEFQKRGLPHAHILLILSTESKIRSIEEYDLFVSAEIPDYELNPSAYETVTTMMMHGPCGILNTSSPCMKDGKCKKHYPKDFQETTQEGPNGYPLYRRKNNGCYIGIQLDNRWVVPYNIKLVEKTDNNEIANSNKTFNEIKMYLDARYVSSSESIWRIFHYKMHGETIHKTTLTAWFEENTNNSNAQNLKYIDFPTHYTWNKDECKWSCRINNTGTIGRLYMVQPTEGERYYLRILLTHVSGATSFNSLKTVNGQICRTFKETCIQLGLLQDDCEWNICLHEASTMKTEKQLRHLFSMILLICQPTAPELLWNTHKLALSLIQIEHYLQSNETSLKNFPDMPIPSTQNTYHNSTDNDLDRLLNEERSYNTTELARQVNQNIPLLNREQFQIYEEVMQAVNDKYGHFFIDGFAGTGKTFLYNTLLATIRLHGDIAIAVASSGIAALLLSGGRTAHSRFKIPLKIDEFSTCNISRNSQLACLINAAKLFIWDEAPMMHKPFGGKVFVFGGDFRQILPVIPHSRRADIVLASLTQSSLWSHIKVMKLSTNMRLQQTSDSVENLKQKEFAEFLLKIGDGTYTINPGTENMITLPSNIVIIKGTLRNLIDFVYPDLVNNCGNADYMVSKAILTPKNINVDIISDIIMDQLPGEFVSYPSADYINLPEDAVEQPQLYSPEFLRSLRIPELPPGELKLKIGVPIILLRNLNPFEGLCNGTRLICCGFQSKVIDAEIITGSHIGKRVFIPCITLTSSETKLPFVLSR
ncbi:18179_t:CDS:2 [Rhizophagus irregularis]|nr:18179_t:CDS:2 [Rhizophagus irregularis]